MGPVLCSSHRLVFGLRNPLGRIDQAISGVFDRNRETKSHALRAAENAGHRRLAAADQLSEFVLTEAVLVGKSTQPFDWRSRCH